jgi:dolichol-phosphate mannosyltransferase
MDFLKRVSAENHLRILRFCAVGVSGIGVNLLVTLAVKEVFFSGSGAWSALNVAAALGTIVSIFSNFLLNDIWTWGDRSKTSAGGWWVRVGKYYLTASLGAGLELGVFNLAIYLLGPGIYLWAKLAGIAFATVTNFSLMHFWVFRSNSAGAQEQP